MTETTNIPAPEAPPQTRGKRRKLLLAALAALVLFAALAALRWNITDRREPLWTVLPPGSDVYLYADLQALQSNAAVKWYLSESPALPKDEANETQRFEEATGFLYQRDLQELAAARKDGDWVGVARVSANQQRWEDYFQSRASKTERAADAAVYVFGSERPLKVSFVRDDVLVFSIGEADDEWAQMLLLLSQRPGRDAALDGISRSLSAKAAPRLLPLTARPMWLAADGEKLLGNVQDGDAPSFGGFLLGEETLEGIETIFASIESSTLTLLVEGELLTRSETDPQPLANNLSLLASLMRPSAPSEGKRDLRPLWDALEITPQDSAILIRWRPTTQMLMQLTAATD